MGSTLKEQEPDEFAPGRVFERRGEAREIVSVLGDEVMWRKPGSVVTHRMWVSYWRRWLEKPASDHRRERP